MEIETEKAALIERLRQINDISLLKAISHLVDYGMGTNDDISEYNRELEQADREITKGDFLNHDEAIADIRSWREK